MTGARAGNDAEGRVNAGSDAEQTSTDQVALEIERIRAATRRDLAKFRLRPWYIVGFSVVFSLYIIVNESPNIDFNWVLGGSIAVVVPGVFWKIFRDGRQKARLRDIITDLESDNRGLREERDSFREEAAELRGRLKEAHRRN